MIFVRIFFVLSHFWDEISRSENALGWIRQRSGRTKPLIVWLLRANRIDKNDKYQVRAKPSFYGFCVPYSPPALWGPRRSLLKIWPGIKVYGNSHRSDMLLGFNNHKTVIAHYISLLRSRVIWWMIQLVPSLKYNRSIDSAINLALVNIQKQEQRQQGHASHIHIWQCSFRNIDIVTLRSSPKGCLGSFGAYSKSDYLVDTAKY